MHVCVYAFVFICVSVCAFYGPASNHHLVTLPLLVMCCRRIHFLGACLRAFVPLSVCDVLTVFSVENR